MKLNNGIDITGYAIPQLAQLRDKLIAEHQLKLQDTREKQAKLAEMQQEVLKMQDEVIKMQDETIALGEDVVAVAQRFEEAVRTAHTNN